MNNQITNEMRQHFLNISCLNDDRWYKKLYFEIDVDIKLDKRERERNFIHKIQDDIYSKIYSHPILHHINIVDWGEKMKGHVGLSDDAFKKYNCK